jgi:hypothetical protein
MKNRWGDKSAEMNVLKRMIDIVLKKVFSFFRIEHTKTKSEKTQSPNEDPQEDEEKEEKGSVPF